MKNLLKSDLKVAHVFISPFKAESRVIKQMHSLKNACKESTAFFIGVKDEDVPSYETYADKFQIFREEIKSRSLPRLLFFQILKYSEWACRAYYRLKKLTPDIVHCHSLGALPVAVLAKLKLKCVLVYDAHELESERNHYGFLKNFFLSFIEKNLIHPCNSILVVSPSIKKYYERKFPKKKIFLLVNACSKLEKEDSDVLNLRDKFKINSDDFLFVYTGDLSYGRGIELYLKVFEELPTNYHLVYMGDGPLRESIVEASRAMSNVHYLPPVPWNKVVNVAGQADYVLRVARVSSLSYKYALPNTFFQALSSNVPIIINEECEEMIEFCNDSEMCIPSKYDEQALYQLIRGLQKRCKRSLNPLASKFAWEFYENVLFDSYTLCFEN